MSMHAVKLSELELFKNKAEATIQTSQDSYGRINTRLEAFKVGPLEIVVFHFIRELVNANALFS